MAITKDDWENIKPNEHNILDYTGVTWQVVEKVEDTICLTVILKTLRRAQEEFSFAPALDGYLGILDSKGGINFYLNHPGTNIVSK